MSSNGGGMGHLTRLLGIARRLPDDHEAFFLTMSTGVEAVRKQGFWADYMPGPQSGELRDKKWVSYLKRRVVSALRDLAPDAFVFDGTFAYRGLTDALDQFPGIHKTWSRRGMWKPISAKRAERALSQTQSFDLVIEPGELAAEVDRGVTREQHHLLRRLEPMLLLNDGEILSRPQARRELGIPEDRVAVLLNLGAGNINDIDNLVAAVTEIMRERTEVHVVALQSLIAAVDLPASDRITKLQTYPLARVLRAFDVCVAAPGYNSFHELLSSAIPTVFIPNEQTALDDQRARAVWAHDAQLAQLSRFDDPDSLREALSLLLDTESRQAMRERLEALPPCRGAQQAVELIVSRARSVTKAPHPPWKKVLLSVRPLGERLVLDLLRRLDPRALTGAAAPPGSLSGDRVLLIVDVETSSEAATALIEQHTQGGQAPLLMTRGSALKAFAQHGVTVEMLLDHTLETGPEGLDQAAYLDQKIQALVSAYGIGRIVCVGDAVVSRRVAQMRAKTTGRRERQVRAGLTPNKLLTAIEFGLEALFRVVGRTRPAAEYDVVLLSDFRFPGGTSYSNAEEIKAQSRSGFTTGLLQVASPVLKKERPINPAIQQCLDAGLATLIPPTTPTRCKLLVVRHPTVLTRPKEELPRVQADGVVVIVNQPPMDRKTGTTHYSIAECQRNARDRFGTAGTWFPIGPLVRQEIQHDSALENLSPQDWVNIINVDDWKASRTRYVSDRPVIGRHSRDAVDKWPDDAETLLQVYPVDGEFQVRVLGGAEYAREVLGYLPEAWEVLPFGATPARDFLAGIDLFVYYHHPQWVEAFGRTILEALASGAPAILPPHFEDLFEDVPLYTEPSGVRDVVKALYRDRRRYEQHSRRGIEFVERRFGYGAHAQRLREQILHASDLSPSVNSRR